MSVFKNPLGTPVGQRLNTAISHGQSAIDYPLVMEVCDIINDTDHGPKDAKSAFKKLLFTTKDMGQVLQTLNILDICMKNGQKRFHRHIITKDFVLDMAKLAQTGKSSHSAVREKCLLLIQSWADAYRGKEDLGVAAEIYDQLKSNGVEFPAVNLDDMAPIRTPPSRQDSETMPPPQANLPFSPPQQAPYPTQQAALPTQQAALPTQQAALPAQQAPYPTQQAAFPTQQTAFPTQQAAFPTQQAALPTQQAPYPTQQAAFPTQQAPYPTQQAPYPIQQPSFPAQQPAASAPQSGTGRGNRNLSGEQMAKLISETDVVQTNVQVLSDLLLNSVPGQDRREDIEFMQALKDTIQNMQVRVMDLLSGLSTFPNTEDITARMLQLNDDMNNVFTRHERYMRQSQAANNPDSAQRPIQIPEEPLPDNNISYPSLSVSSPKQLDPPQPLNSEPPAYIPPVAKPRQTDTTADMLLLDFGTDTSGQDATPSILPLSSSQPQEATSGEQEASSEVDEFDIFAKSRQSTYASEFVTTSYSDTQPQPTSVNKALKRSISPEDAKGLTEWLAATDLTTASKVEVAPEETSEAFDKFLAERAKAAYSDGESSGKSKKKPSTNDIDDMFSL